jgi:hypothetical protein
VILRVLSARRHFELDPRPGLEAAWNDGVAPGWSLAS